MEFLPMRRFRKINNAKFPKLSELKKINPITVTMDLQVLEAPENVENLNRLAAQGLELFPVRRISLQDAYQNRKDFPLRVLFEMTSICNIKCKMCPQMNLKRKLMYMDKEKYKSIVEELDSFGLDGLWLYHFGESLTHPNFKELVEYINTKKNLGYIWLSTNGTLLNEQLIDFLLSSSLGYLNFSLQSISVEKYQEISPNAPAERILSNLHSLIEKKQKLLGSKPYFRLQIIEQESTLDEIDTFLRTYHDKCDLISVNMLEHTDLEFNKKSKFLRQRNERIACKRLGRSDCFINSDGSIAICDNMYNNELDIGNIWEKSVYEIWNGAERKKIIKMNEEGGIWNVSSCSECSDYDL